MAAAVVLITAWAALAFPTAAGATGPGAPAIEAAAKAKAKLNTLTGPKAAVLGLVEGITEYLPISSTGHLLLAERLLDIGQGKDKNATDTFTVVIQIGAILAVLGIFRKRFVSMAEGLVGRSVDGRNALIALVVAFIPAAVVGQLFGDPIKEHLLEPWPVVAAWAVGGVVILVFVAQQGRFRAVTTSVGAITVRQAAIIGIAQTLALWPGTSRSLVTILAAVALGMSLQVAVEFSFLLGFVTLSAATAYELLKNGKEMFDVFGVVNPLIGTVIAGIAAFLAVKWMLSWLQTRPLTVFGWYRLGAAALGAVLILAGSISS